METEPVKVLQLEYPTISYTNKLHEGNRKTLLTQTLHRKTLKLLHEIEIFFRLRRATNLTSLGKLLRSYFVTIIQTLQYIYIYIIYIYIYITHVEQSHPAKTYNGSHPLSVFAKQPILNA